MTSYSSRWSSTSRLSRRLGSALCLLLLIASFGSPQLLTNRSQLTALIGVAAGCDNFETLTFGGNYFALSTATLNSSTVVGSQTNLVQPGASYVSKAGNVAWLNNGFLGGPTKRIWANGSAGLDINYMTPVRAFGLDFFVGSGFGGNITAKVHTVSSGVITIPFTFTSVQNPYFFGYADASGITKVEFFDNNGNAAVSIDDHCYGCPARTWWCENFSPYPYGDFLSGGGWHTWTSGATSEKAIIQDNFCSPYKAMQVLTDTDMVREFTCVDNGKWIFKTSWWVPSNNNQNTYILLLNRYPAGSGTEWSVQIGANNTAVTYYPAGALQGTTSTSIPIVKTNQYVDMCIMIDFSVPNGSVDVYWDGRPLVLGKSWKATAASLMQLAAVDVYGGNLGGTSWVDDMALVRNCPRTWWRDIPDSFSPFFPIPNYVRPAFNAAFSPNRGYDNGALDRLFGSSFVNLPYGPCVNFKGDLLLRGQPLIASSSSDFLKIGWTGGSSFVYNSTLAAASSTPWSAPQVPTNIFLNLDANPTTTPNLLQNINATGFLDILSGWMSRFDYARLRLWNCRPWWRGLTWTPWDATTMVDPGMNGTIHVMNEGGSGSVLNDVGESTGYSASYESMPDLKVANRRWCEFPVGTLNGASGQNLCRVWTVGNGSQVQLNADFSALGSAQARVSFYGPNGSLVGESGPPGILMALLLPQPQIMVKVIETDFHLEPGGSGAPSMIWCDMIILLPCTLRSNGVDYPNVSRIRIRPVNPTVPAGPVTGHLIDVDGVDEFTIGNAGINMFGLPIEATGDAVLEAGNGQLYVTGIGSSGNDGVSVSLGAARMWSLDFLTEVTNPMQVGMCVSAEAFGRKNNINDSPLGRSTICRTATGYAFTADYTAVESPNVRLRLLNGSTVLADIPHHSAAVGESDSLPYTCGKGTEIDIGPPCFWWEWSSSIQFRVDGGGTYNVTRIEILAEPPQGTTVGPYSRLTFEGTGVEEMFINRVTAYRGVTGQIHPLDLSTSPAGYVMTVEIRPHGSTTPLETQQVVLDASGNFSLATHQVGDLDIAVKGSHWLRKVQRHEIDVSGLSGLVYNLTNGDCDGDNEVAIGDFAMISSSFNSSLGDPGFLPGSDLNGDEATDIGDYAILSSSYGMIGDD